MAVHVCGGVGLTERVTSVAISQTFLDCPASVMPFASSLRLQAVHDQQEGGVRETLSSDRLYRRPVQSNTNR